ncbi:MAG TPA: tetratricopeptide repeat protein [Thermoanaerobaculia bacterium]|jgi:pentatricopeptide repeat protein|nr:tetratricopeptide repeat protein [Thermoanaerobaculia bacterium]
MAQPGITAKIEELQFRIKTDPKSRLFFPLAEEFRKNGKLAEAEQVLRTGLGVHATYLSAWVSLGRVLREQHKNAEAVEALKTALQVDPGNVVAARLLADAYLDLGEKVEAIKKYKLVHALMPSDEELEAKIAQLDRDLGPAPEPLTTYVGSRESGVEDPPEAPLLTHETLTDRSESPFAESKPDVEETLQPPTPDPRHPDHPEPPFAPEPRTESPFDDTTPTLPAAETPFDTGDEIPMAAQHDDSPFEEPSGYTAAALEIEHPEGMHIEEAPLVAEVPAVWTEDVEPDADVFAPAEPEAVAQADDDLTSTTTMADLYVRQGLVDQARKIYQHMLERDPANHELRWKLDALDESPAEAPVAEAEAAAADEEIREPGNPATLHNHAKVVVLQQWLTKVAKRELPGA